MNKYKVINHYPEWGGFKFITPHVGSDFGGMFKWVIYLGYIQIRCYNDKFRKRVDDLEDSRITAALRRIC